MPKKMEVFKKSLLAVAVFSALVGCSEPPPKYTTENAMIDFKKANPIKVMDSYNRTLIVADSFALFNSGSSQFKDGAEDVLQDAVDVIEGLSPNLKIKVAAYATSVGNQQYTDELTKAQAAAVAAYLWSQGIDAKRMTVYAGGKRDRVADASPANVDIMNYRVEITLTDRGAKK